MLKRWKSFKYAFQGLISLIKDEPNARIHIFASLVVIISGVFFELTSFEWIGIFFSIGFVLSAEAFNTSIENLADFISPERNNAIKKVKDIAAAAVLVSALTAFIIGLIVFGPKLVGMIEVL